MTGWALGLSVGLVVGTSVALATPASERCDCGPRMTVLPQPGAINVPRNTKRRVEFVAQPIDSGPTTRSIDLAGNESKPTVRQVDVALGSSPLDPCARSHARCGAAGALLFVATFALAPIVLTVLIVVITLVFMYASRRRALRSAVAEPLSSLAGERLARGSQVRAGLVAVLGLAGVPVLVVQFGSDGVLPIVSTIIACIGIRGFLVARASLAMIESGRAEVVSRAHRLVVKVGDTERSIALGEDRIANARRRYAVPRSIAHTRRPIG